MALLLPRTRLGDNDADGVLIEPFVAAVALQIFEMAADRALKLRHKTLLWDGV